MLPWRANSRTADHRFQSRLAARFKPSDHRADVRVSAQLAPHKRMKPLTDPIRLACLLLLTIHTAAIAEGAWMPSVQHARDIALRDERFVMLYFTGSDWCGWCKRLDKEVLDTEIFLGLMRDYLAPVKIDFPKKRVVSEAEYRANLLLAESYKVQGYPTLVFLDSDGREVLRRGYQEGGGHTYVQNLVNDLRKVADTTLKRRHGRVMANIEKQHHLQNPGPPPPLFGGAIAATPVRYTNLVLKSISGNPKQRFILLNNQTLATGEAAPVKLHDGSVKVRCLEIRDRSALISVAGESEPREISLAGTQ